MVKVGVMRHFFIQEGGLLPDFCYEALRAAEFENWREPGSVAVHRVESAGLAPIYRGTPIGSVEFVSSFSMSRGLVPDHPRPLNIPEVLVPREFTSRKIWKGVIEDPGNLPSMVFAKSALRYKGFSGMVASIDLPAIIATHGALDLSEEVEFSDEWRAFVHAGRLVGLHCYSGLFERVPSREFLSRAMQALSAGVPSLRSYTLDVGFIGDTEAVVEVHPFVSCGLYGFRDYRVLLSMFEQGYKSFLVTK